VVGLNFAGGYGSQVPMVAQIPAQIADAARHLNTHWARMDFTWWRVDPGECPAATCFDWSRTDTLMHAAAANGVSVVAILGGPGWPTGATSAVNPSATFWPQYVTAFTRRYDHTVPNLVIEPWNEPELNGFPPSQAGSFMAQFQIPAYNAVKAVDHSVLVHLATVDYASGYGQAWWVNAVAAAAGRAFADLPGFHDYANGAGTWTGQLRALLNSHGVTYTAIWNSEFGAGMALPVGNPDQPHITVIQSHLPPTRAGTSGAPDATFYYAYSDLAEGGSVRASYGLTATNGAHYASYAVFQHLMGGS
jgi:hypothetical protein